MLTMPALAGCLTSTPPAVSHWPVEFKGAGNAESAPVYGVARVSQVTVRAPYGAEGIAVMRSGGTLETDAYNLFAAAPALLLKGVVFDALTASGKFSAVVNSSSSAVSAVSVEVMVTRLALDCREGGGRKAVAETLLRLVRGGEIVFAATGEGEADAAAGNYGASFSRAVSAALSEALGEIK